MRILLIGPVGPNAPIVKIKEELESRGHITKLINDMDELPKFLTPDEFIDCTERGKEVPLSRLYWKTFSNANLIIVEEGRPIFENDIGPIKFKNDIGVPVVYIDRECVHGPSVHYPDYFIYRSDISYDILKLANQWYCSKNAQNIVKHYPCIDPTEFSSKPKVRSFVAIGMNIKLKFRPVNWIVSVSYKYIKRWHDVLHETHIPSYSEIIEESKFIEDWTKKHGKFRKIASWFQSPVSYQEYKKLVETSCFELIHVNPLEPITRRIFEAGLSKTVPILYLHEDDNTSLEQLRNGGFIHNKTCIIVCGFEQLMGVVCDFEYGKCEQLLKNLELLILHRYTYKSFVTKLLELVK